MTRRLVTAQSRSAIEYHTLKSAIVTNRLPPGSVVSEGRMGEICMSRTPGRDALNRLEEHRLVRRVRNHGVFVAAISLDEFHDICEVRALLEGHACRIAAKRAQKA